MIALKGCRVSYLLLEVTQSVCVPRQGSSCSLKQWFPTLNRRYVTDQSANQQALPDLYVGLSAGSWRGEEEIRGSVRREEGGAEKHPVQMVGSHWGRKISSWTKRWENSEWKMKKKHFFSTSVLVLLYGLRQVSSLVISLASWSPAASMLWQTLSVQVLKECRA